MAVGYEGMVWLKVGAIEDVVLCNSVSVPRSRVRLEASSGYGGQIKTPVDEIGIGLPRTYDWESHEGSLDFDLTQDFLTNQIKPWIFDRQKSSPIRLKTRRNNVQEWDNSFWNSISLSTGEGQSTTGSISFTAIKRDSYSIGGGYIYNVLGELNGSSSVICNPPVNTNVPSPLNPSNGNITPIPFWNTRLELDSVQVSFINWGLEFSQEVIPFFACENNVNPVAPRFIAVGPLTIRFSGDYIFVDETSPWNIPDTMTTLDVFLGGEVIHLGKLDLDSASDSLQGVDSLTSIAVEYTAYELAA